MPFTPWSGSGGSSGGGIQPWQFYVKTYGAKGNGRLVSDGAITSGTNALACTTSQPFTSGDVGKAIYIVGAGAAGADLFTTISGFTDSGHVALTANAGTTVTAHGVNFGTDDTAAIIAAQTAAVSFAQANFGYAEILFDALIYTLATAATVGATLQGNAVIPFPLISGASQKITLVYRGKGTVSGVPHWLQTQPFTAGTVLSCLRLDGTNDATYGPAFVVGGPYNTYGGENGTFNNMHVIVDGIMIQTPFNSTFGGWGFFGTAQATILDGAFMPMAVAPAQPQPWPTLNQANITNQWSYGVQMPSAGNNDKCDIFQWAGYGATYGILFSEHTTVVSTRCNYCIIGLEAYCGPNNAIHGARIIYASIEQCAQTIGFLDHFPRLTADMLDVETSGNPVYDPGNIGRGVVAVRGFGAGYGNMQNGGTSVRIINLDNDPGPVTSPQAPPASGSAWANQYYRDAFITLHATTSVTALSIGSVAQNIVAGSNVSFSLPSGQSYTPTYTGTLTHTVVLT